MRYNITSHKMNTFIISFIFQDLYRLVKIPQEHWDIFALWISSKTLGKYQSSYFGNSKNYDKKKKNQRFYFDCFMTELQLADSDQPLKIFYGWKKLLTQHSSLPKGVEDLPSLYLWRNAFFPASQEKTVFHSF